ncbi:VOC family protein [Pelagibacterium halotolerans]|uniref:Lactoylglutathione lyase-related lyase n=1 Tax=Pelagibacterium halotolerans (strain DSM 22347 / JCM 15775 / CGMCC 1.7692 / B2) TaxID=1082931 RepID=G4R6C8_PELHB|nr:VOC family protein [Pelagibacterium halotolerans]AEQ53193.1 lactoylglutathione lyase-related lyase [Pelagibacterium halotolerans B2]QJR17169.1 VOC family protein [Pelagibacterium halotolerans]SEA89845.1 Predicted lactoylglutathione lyase [Pelagibacterium halotolerans]
MELHRGRLIDHVHLRVKDLEKSRDFYRAALGALGRELTFETDAFFVSDELFVDAADTYVTRVHLAFQTDGPEMVRAFHAASLEAGGTDNGAPGERPYHPGYYACFILDPDGNNIEAVWHGPHQRNAASVAITPDMP